MSGRYCWCLDTMKRTENTKGKPERKRNGRESTPLRDPVATGVSNSWRRRTVDGFISVGVRSVGTSVAATALRGSMSQSTPRQPGIRSLPTSSPVRIGPSVSTRVAIKGVDVTSAALASLDHTVPGPEESSIQSGIASPLAGVDPFQMRMSNQYLGISRYVRLIDSL
jgi:hypothetical protein